MLIRPYIDKVTSKIQIGSTSFYGNCIVRLGSDYFNGEHLNISYLNYIANH